MKKLALLALLAAPIFAENLTWETLANSVNDEPSVQAAEKKSGAVSSGTSTKLWNSLEFEYKLDGFGFMDHEFELKYKPKDFGEGSANKSYWRAQGDYLKTKSDIERSSLLYDRYERALRYLTRVKIQNIHQQLADVNNDRIEVLHIKSGSATFNPSDLIDALERKAELSAELVADSNSLQNAELRFKSWMSFNEVALDSNFLPSLEEISEALESDKEVDDSYLEVAEAKQKWAVAEGRYKQEKVGSNRILSSIGLGYKYSRGSYEYDSVKTGNYNATYSNVGVVYEAEKEWKVVRKPDDRRDRDKFYATVTLRLPFFGTDGGDETKRQIDVLDAESDYLDKKRSVSREISHLKEETLALITQVKLQREFQESVNAGEIFTEFAERSGSDPLLLLRAKEVSLESDLKITKLEYEIYARYLELLELSGAFANPDASTHFQGR